MISLITRLLGAAPAGIETLGSLASGPLVGVFTAVVAVGVVADAVLLASDSSALFSLPTVIVLLEPLEPHPAMSAAAASVARPRPARERTLRELFRLVTARQTSGTPITGATGALRSKWTVLGGEVAVP